MLNSSLKDTSSRAEGTPPEFARGVLVVSEIALALVCWLARRF